LLDYDQASLKTTEKNNQKIAFVIKISNAQVPFVGQ